jgi:hypothetical protein
MAEPGKLRNCNRVGKDAFSIAGVTAANQWDAVERGMADGLQALLA